MRARGLVQLVSSAMLDARRILGGYPDHGPMEGPKVSIPADTGGSIVDTEKPYRTMDQLLYVVRWDTGQTSKHYFKQLCGIGQYAIRRLTGSNLGLRHQTAVGEERRRGHRDQTRCQEANATSEMCRITSDWSGPADAGRSAAALAIRGSFTRETRELCRSWPFTPYERTGTSLRTNYLNRWSRWTQARTRYY